MATTSDDSVPNLSGTQAAVVAGISERHFRRMLADGNGPPQAPNGTLPPGPFRDWLRARFAEEFGVGVDGQAPASLEAEKTRLTRAQADKTELEVAELAGDLCRTDEVTTAWGDKNAAARAKFLGFPAKIAQRIAPPERIAEVQKLAQEVVYEVLLELAGDGLPERTRARRANSGRDMGAAAGPDGESVGRPESKAVARVKRRTGKVVDSDG